MLLQPLFAIFHTKIVQGILVRTDYIVRYMFAHVIAYLHMICDNIKLLCLFIPFRCYEKVRAFYRLFVAFILFQTFLEKGWPQNHRLSKLGHEV